jgi:hypothetical protein
MPRLNKMPQSTGGKHKEAENVRLPRPVIQREHQEEQEPDDDEPVELMYPSVVRLSNSTSSPTVFVDIGSDENEPWLDRFEDALEAAREIDPGWSLREYGIQHFIVSCMEDDAHGNAVDHFFSFHGMDNLEDDDPLHEFRHFHQRVRELTVIYRNLAGHLLFDQIIQFPESVRRFTNLRKLEIVYIDDFTNNHATQKRIVFPNMIMLPRLFSIRINGFNIEQIPEFIFQPPLADLEYIEITDSNIRVIPDRIVQFVKQPTIANPIPKKVHFLFDFNKIRQFPSEWVIERMRQFGERNSGIVRAYDKRMAQRELRRTQMSSSSSQTVGSKRSRENVVRRSESHGGGKTRRSTNGKVFVRSCRPTLKNKATLRRRRRST